MSEETQRELRQVPRIDYQILHSTGAVVLRTPDQSSPAASSTSAPDDTSSVSSNESSSESTLTPASSDNDLLDATLVNESLGDQILTSSPRVPLIDQPSVNHLADSSSRIPPVNQPSVLEDPFSSSSTGSTFFEVLSEIEGTFKMSEGQKEILRKINLLIEGLNDYIDENSMNDTYVSIEDIDEKIKRAENMRSEYRKLHIELEAYDLLFLRSFVS